MGKGVVNGDAHHERQANETKRALEAAAATQAAEAAARKLAEEEAARRHAEEEAARVKAASQSEMRYDDSTGTFVDEVVHDFSEFY